MPPPFSNHCPESGGELSGETAEVGLHSLCVEETHHRHKGTAGFKCRDGQRVHMDFVMIKDTFFIFTNNIDVDILSMMAISHMV